MFISFSLLKWLIVIITTFTVYAYFSLSANRTRSMSILGRGTTNMELCPC